MVHLLCSAHSCLIMTIFSVLTLLVDSAPTITVSHLYSAMKSEAKHMYWDTFTAFSQFQVLRVGHSLSDNWSLAGLPSLTSWVVLERMTASVSRLILPNPLPNVTILEFITYHN
ncbi:uncharacterized protein LOC117111475 [Anneissia japonica]|uniref:uncharacterized protein LOC117111475 n=1 Tax=Anneissia japonica TaxID=1529436 RepID=UPI0014257F64|nr:uncharacterized protein LOC117111475 [Anneissia japonica]